MQSQKKGSLFTDLFADCFGWFSLSLVAYSNHQTKGLLINLSSAPSLIVLFSIITLLRMLLRDDVFYKPSQNTVM